MAFIPYGHQVIGDDDLQIVRAVLKSDYLTQGPYVRKFEEAVAKYCGVKYAVAVSSGTAALHLAYLALGVNKGDEAITSPITFLATSNAALYVGAKPVFADIGFSFPNISVCEIKKKISKRTKVILPVHFSGHPCAMDEIHVIAKTNKCFVVEDACHALGSKYYHNGQWVTIGSCRHSDMCVFSFHPVKTITSGEGGMITTNNKKLYGRLLKLRCHGMEKNKSTEKKGPWYYEMKTLGYNYRMSDMQAALGFNQLKKISRFIAQRRLILAGYNEAFSDQENISVLPELEGCFNAAHLCVLLIDFKNIGQSRKDFMLDLRSRGVGTQVHYIPVYRQPYYKKLFNLDPNDFPRSEMYYSRCVSIPLFPTLNQKEIKKVITSIKDMVS
ncbi:MAG: UDP-4-amino-4,6-dideoxy-N-acetyl-beta-L-altrosamine transaminase [Candidatus Omnitrophica bacterium]|nr:UDP-4-amino-4,6-dideoxy-N-acetyl-beta-L-altrosamine transaminase [Candidatus Omnitrophota bacterium]